MTLSISRDALLPGDSSPDNASEQATVARARAGDREAFGELHHRYVRMVHAIVLAHASHRDAADLTQEVFTRALINITNLRDNSAAGPWLASIARNVARDSIRSRKLTSELPDSLPSPAAAESDAHEILSVIHELPETYRETMVMRLVEGMTGPEIADRCGMTPGSVRVHLHRGMKILTEALQRRGLLEST